MATMNGIEIDIAVWRTDHNVLDGDEIVAAEVNDSPISNRTDIIQLNTIIGDTDTLVDVTADSYDPEIDNDLADPNADLISILSQIRIDTGDKEDLKTTSKTNIVSAINELNDKIYQPERSAELIAVYDFSTHGNYIIDGGDINFVETLQESELPSKRIKGAYPFNTERIGIINTSTEFNSFDILKGTYRVNGYEYRIDSSCKLYFQNSYQDVASTNLDRLKSNLNATLISEDVDYDYFEIQNGASVYSGIYDIQSFMGLKRTVGSISFTIDSGNTVDSGDGTNITTIGTDLRDYIESSGTEGNIDFDSVQIDLIDQVITVLSVAYPFEITSNGQGIHWTTSNPPLNESFSIDATNLYYYGIKTGTNVDNPTYGIEHAITIENNRTTIKVPKLLGFYNGVGDFGSESNPASPELDFNIVLPRTDSLYMRIIKNDYDEELWDENTSYKIKDIVVYNGIVYSSLVDLNTSNQPDLTVSVSWDVLGTAYSGLTLQPEFILGEGDVDSNDFPTLPKVGDNTYLRLCNIFNFYGLDPVVTNIENRSYSMQDINNLAKGIENLEYNVQRLALSVDMNANDSTATRDMFVEGFNDDTFRDTSLETSHIDDDTKQAYSADIVSGRISNPINWNMSILQAQNAGENIQTPVQLNSIEGSSIVEQDIFTKSTLINEFQLSAPPIVNLTVFPRVHRYISQRQTINLARTVNTTIVNNTSTLTEASVRDWADSLAVWMDRPNTTSSVTSTSRVVTSVSTASSITTRRINTPEEIIPYNLSLSAPAGSFNGEEEVQVVIDNVLQTQQTSSVDGSLNSSITVSGFYTGENEVEVLGIGTGVGDISAARGVAYIKTEAFSQVVVNITTTTNTTIIDSVTNITRYSSVPNFDPVAQTFLVKKDIYIHSLYIKIDAEDINGDPYEFPDGKLPENIDINLFETTAGMPDWEKVISTASIPKGTSVVISNNAWIKAEFYSKVKLYENNVYAVVIATPYESYRRVDSGGGILDVTSDSGTRLKVKVAEVGQSGYNDTGSLIYVSAQPYIDGVLLKSSNKVTWTPYQLEDLTFKLTGCTFESSKVQDYQIIEGLTSYTDVTDLRMQLDTHIELGTSVTTILKHDNGSIEMNPILDTYRVEKQDINNISVDVTLSNMVSSLSDSSETPLVDSSGGIYFGTVAEKAVYVTKNIDLSNGQGNRDKFIKLYIDGNEYFSDNKVKVYYTTDFVINNDHTDIESSWTEFTRDLGYIGFQDEYFYSSGSTVSVGASLRIKIVLNIDLASESSFARAELKNMRLFLADS